MLIALTIWQWKTFKKHLPVYFTIHHLYSTGEHPVIFERTCDSTNSRERNPCWQLQISQQIIHISVLPSLQKRIADVSSAPVTYQNCSTHHNIIDRKREASANLCVPNEDTDLWLVTFTNTLKNLLQQVSSMTLQNTTEKVVETLHDTSNILITFNPRTNVVSELQRVLSSDNQTSGKIEATNGNGATDDNETTSANGATDDHETTSGNGPIDHK